MGYMHIQNLYKDQRILLFRECYALEKVHGTSAHVYWRTGELGFFSGGEKHENFVNLFDHIALREKFAALGHQTVTVFGEAYGGRQQGMKDTYGPVLRFIAFDVQIGDHWVAVPDMDHIAASLGFEVVPYRKVSTDLAALDAERDRFSEVAERRGIHGKPREGVVLRPLVEVRTTNDGRLIAKHKGEAFSERAHTPRVSREPPGVLARASAIADEWVTEMRLSHVLDKMPGAQIEDTGKVIAAMVEDVYREAKGEIVESEQARRAIGRRAAEMFKARIRNHLREGR